MSGGCWNYMNDSAASEILGYHIYVGYGLDSDKHEKNYKQVVRDTPAAGAADMIIAPPKPTEKVGFKFCRHAAVYTPGPQEIR